jgi:polysaccharide pyruvyl transferase WcaK-like protein
MTIVILGWYGSEINNLGDNLFKEAFKKLFPEHTLIFTDTIEASAAHAADAFFIGGGSFLGDKPNIDPSILELVKSKPLFYIGVGAETNIHERHQELIRIAKLVAIRNSDERIIDRVKQLNTNTIYVPDLVYMLAPAGRAKHRRDRILVIPNLEVVPRYFDPQWKHTAWGFFKSEFAQALDHFIDTGIGVDFYTMCNNADAKDYYAAIELFNFMKPRKTINFYDHNNNIDKDVELLSSYKMIITQRYHGIILAEIAETPHIILWHHDKLKSHPSKSASFIGYYGATKQAIIDGFSDVTSKDRPNLAIDSNSWESIVNQVKRLW